MAKSTVLLRSNPVSPDPRVERIAKWLVSSGRSCIVLGWDRLIAWPIYEVRGDYTIIRAQIKAGFGAGKRNLLPLTKWQFWLLRWLYSHRKQFDMIIAADLDTAVPAALLAKITQKHLIYDIHDYYIDSHNVPKLARNLVKRCEDLIINVADIVLLPDECRKAQIRDTKPKSLIILYNSPAYTEVPPIKRVLGSLRIGYVGILSVERGLLELLEVLSLHPNWELQIAGYGADEETIKRRLKNLSNVRFHGTVSYEFALGIYSQCDLLVATYNPHVPNHAYSSPNKLFEAMMLGKPIVVAAGTHIDKVVEKHELGFVVPYGDVNALESAMKSVAGWDTDEADQFRGRAQIIYHEFYDEEAMKSRLLNNLPPYGRTGLDVREENKN